MSSPKRTIQPISFLNQAVSPRANNQPIVFQQSQNNMFQQQQLQKPIINTFQQKPINTFQQQFPSQPIINTFQQQLTSPTQNFQLTLVTGPQILEQRALLNKQMEEQPLEQALQQIFRSVELSFSNQPVQRSQQSVQNRQKLQIIFENVQQKLPKILDLINLRNVLSKESQELKASSLQVHNLSNTTGHIIDRSTSNTDYRNEAIQVYDESNRLFESLMALSGSHLQKYRIVDKIIKRFTNLIISINIIQLSQEISDYDISAESKENDNIDIMMNNVN
jgi:hypothetical protein